MYRTESVLALLALYVGLAQSFSWDVVVAGEKQLEFYDNNGTRTHIEDIPSINTFVSLAYDPVHNRVLFSQRNDLKNFSICSFDIVTRKIIFLFESDEYGYALIDYDPATQLLFWTETGYGSRHSILSKPGYTTSVEQNILIKVYEDIDCFTVDSCGGYIYWGTETKIERARFDGSEREVVIVKKCEWRRGLAIDHQTQKMYWLDNLYYPNYQMTVESADLNGENRRTLYIETSKQPLFMYTALLVSKDFIYWRTSETFSQLTKIQPQDKDVGPKQFMLVQSSNNRGMALNYKIEDQNSETDVCASLNVSTDVSLLCVHGTKVYGESRCECKQGHIGERCEVSVCHNYCFQGDCSVSAEGQPKCRCNDGYSGERCEINVNNILKGWRIDMDHAMTKSTDDIIKGALQGLREEMEINIMSKLNASIKFTLSDMKQEMNNLHCSEQEKLKESVRTVAHGVSRLKSPVQFQAAEQKDFRNVSTPLSVTALTNLKP